MWKIVVILIYLSNGQPVKQPEALIYTPKSFETQAACEAFKAGDQEFLGRMSELRQELAKVVPDGIAININTTCRDDISDKD
jgi:hypothetical protein